MKRDVSFQGGDTIAALSTPPGSSGIGIVRLSGPRSLEVAAAVFRPSRARDGAFSFVSHTMHHGYVYDAEGDIDEVLLCVMRAPRSFTREDVVEINCHGGGLPVRRVLGLCLERGARLALPGEFTRRAFLNGRIDLVQAEAVIDVINARSEAALKAATAQLEGAVSMQVNTWRESLLDLLVRVEVELDFPEEELEEADYDEVGKALGELLLQMERLADSFREGRLLREGIKVVLAGRPNVGKSSLMNRLLKQERAIVTAVAGTTRDTIEEACQLAGFPLRLIDTAGITHSTDEVEREGIRRSRRKLEQADLVLLVLDGSRSLRGDDYLLLDMVDDKKTVVVVNKQDLPQAIEREELARRLPRAAVVGISAKYDRGTEELEEGILALLHHGGEDARDEVLLTNLRHQQALERAVEALRAAREGSLPELIATDIKEGLDRLGEIVGLGSTDDLLERIFSGFCIGK